MNSAPSQGRWLLPVLLTVQFLVSLDMSVVNIALPAIRDDLGFTPEGLPWVVNAYALAFGGLLMLGGRIADLVGHRRILVVGFVLFGTASLVGGLVSSPGALIAARAVQGVGAAALAPVALTLITVNFPAGKERSRALGLWGMAGAAGGAIGVLAGGLLTDLAGWRAVMLVNVPVVLAVLAVTGRGVPADRRTEQAERPDVTGALLVTGGMTLLVLGLVRTETHAWGSVTTLGTLAAAAVLLTAFVLVELRVRQPLLRIGLLSGRPVLAANSFALLMSCGQFAAFYFASLYMQQELGYGPTAAGAAFLPFCAGVVAGSVLAPRAVGRFGPGPVLVVGGLVGAAGFVWFGLAVWAQAGLLSAIVGPSLVTSLGIGACFVPLGTAATSGVAAQEAGMASGLLNTSRQIGGSLGLAVLVPLATGAGTTASDGYGTAFQFAAGLLAVASVLVLALLPRATRTRPLAPEGKEAAAPSRTP
ncbi:MFS transporter [Streptomyces sp. NPDC021093]|uniref:MFS transporter n=1 Tax=Streptomyces sp. NPDC021093 TaxID=3365112 RepID=UPI0037B5D75F